MATGAIERFYKITVDGTQAVNNLKKIEKSTSSINNKLSGVGKAMKAAFAIIGAGAIVNDFRNIANEADKIGKTADKIGLTADSLQELRYGAELSGVATNTLDMAMQRFARRAGEAANGSGELAATFNKLGIDLKNSNGTMRETDDILNDYADALANAGSSQEQLRLAFKGFDSEGAALVNMLRDGSKGLDDFRKSAQEAGVVMGGDVIGNSAKFNDMMTKLGKQFTVLRSSFYSAIIPAVTEFVEKLTDVVPKIKKWVDEQTFLSASLTIFARSLQIAWEGLKAFGEVLTWIGKSIAALLAGQFDDLGNVFDEFATNLQENRTNIIASWEELTKALQKPITIEITRGIDPEVEPEILKAATAWEKFKQGATEAADKSKEAGDVIKRAGAKFTESFADGIADMVVSGKANFRDLANSIISDIARMIVKQQIFNAISSQFGGGSGGTTTNAKGNAFLSSTGLPFGIYDKPTYFNMPNNGPVRAFAKGGLLGEQGAEAIMPLKRGSDGKLGVSGGGTTVNVINNTPAQASVSETENADGSRRIDVLIENKMESAIASGRLDRSMNASYGLSRRGF